IRRAFLRLGEEGVVGREAGLALGLAGARRGTDPLELLLQLPLAGRLGLLLLREPLGLLLEPPGVVALERVAPTVIELEDPPGDVVEEVTIVGDGDDRPRILV